MVLKIRKRRAGQLGKEAQPVYHPPVIAPRDGPNPREEVDDGTGGHELQDGLRPATSTAGHRDRVGSKPVRVAMRANAPSWP
jgi:hypothetical protein